MSEGAVPAVSVIVRTYNSAATVLDALASIEAQTVAAEVIVVDSGSTDETLRLVEGRVAQVVHLPHDRFTYGRALNEGMKVAGAPALAPLSSHAVLPHPKWLQTGLAHLEAGAHGACGHVSDGEGRPLSTPLVVDHAYLMAHRYWGFTNTASIISAQAWAACPFDEDLVASEDQEWSWRVTEPGGTIVVDPELFVSGGHRRAAGMRSYHQRMVREMVALSHLRPLGRYSVIDAVRDWGRADPQDPFVSGTKRFGRTRAIDTWSRWVAGRRVGEVPAQVRETV